MLEQGCVARLLTSIGMNIDTQSSNCELVGYQVTYGRVVTLAVWCKAGVNLEKFCRSENIQESMGIWTRNIRPARRRDVAVTVAGLVFNTPDSLITGYIEKFGGKLVSQEIIYAKHGDGYNVEFSDSAVPMGTYHFRMEQKSEFTIEEIQKLVEDAMGLMEPALVGDLLRTVGLMGDKEWT